MKIRHAFDAEIGRENEDRFEAFDDYEERMGEAYVSTSMLYTICARQPYHICVHAEGKEEAMDALFGAATARALKLAKLYPEVSSRVFCECMPEDHNRIEKLKLLGYEGEDGVVRMRRNLEHGPIERALPERCTIVRDYLLDELESRYFLERYNATFSRQRDMAWLKALRNQPDFTRILMIAPDGLAGELVIWSEGDVGVVGVIQSTPKWQNKGVASYLMELARLYWLDHGIYKAQFDVWLRLRPAAKLAESCMFYPAEMLAKYPGIDIWQKNGKPK